MSRLPLETITVKSPILNCDGGDGPLGHPRVFLNMGIKSHVDCPYCGRHYILSADAGADCGHH